MLEISQKDKDMIRELVSRPEWPVMERLLNSHIEDINRIDNLGEIDKIGIEAEVSGRVWAMKQLKKFFTEIGLYTEKVSTRNDTSE